MFMPKRLDQFQFYFLQITEFLIGFRGSQVKGYLPNLNVQLHIYSFFKILTFEATNLWWLYLKL